MRYLALTLISLKESAERSWCYSEYDSGIVEVCRKRKAAEPKAPPQVVDTIGAPGMIRTCDPLIRSQVLYPTELRVRRRNSK